MAGPSLFPIRVKGIFTAPMTVIIMAVRFALELDRPVIVDLKVAAQVHVKTIGLFINSARCRIFVIIILCTHEAIQFDPVDFFLVFLDILGILLDLLGVLGDLLLQDVNFVGIFGVQFFQNRLVPEIAAAFCMALATILATS